MIIGATKMSKILAQYISFWRKYGNARQAIELTAREMGVTVKQVEWEITK
jgi:hypothetical protein